MAYSGAYQRKQTAEPAHEQALPAEPEGEKKRETAPRARGPSLPFDLGSLFAKTEAVGMETDDLLMALILYLMYRESGDTDLLIMLGVMLLT